MKSSKTIFSILLVLSMLISPLASVAPALAAGLPVVDDFEAGLPAGKDANGIPVGFVTFNDPNSTVAISTTTAPPAPVPGAADPNHVLQMNVNVVSYAGFVHNFENATVDAWVPQDWSAYEGISFWLYGNNSGTTMFVDVLDNRNLGSTKDDAERWSVDVKDNFSGWQEIKLKFADMHRKEIGNGAPNDGFGLTEVHGWALGTVTTPAPQVYYVDNVTLYGVAPVKPLTVGFSAINYKVTEGATATVTVKLSKPFSDPVTVQYTTDYSSAIPNRDFTPVSGTLTFAPNITLQTFTVQTMDDQKYQGERGVLLQLSNPTGGAALGIPSVSRVSIQDNESYDAYLLEDFETYPYLWKVDSKAVLSNPEIAMGDALALPGQGAFEHVLQARQKSGTGSFTVSRTFPMGQNWSQSDGFNFWYYGRNSNKSVELSLTNNPAASADPSAWKLVWSDEFNSKVAGTAANPSIWAQEVGDGTANGIAGWGNDELEYYTAGAANAATDGLGHLQITAKQADGSLMCYYGPCQYTSARLLTKDRFEIAYGRVEARIKVPRGAGLWPAFWMLGTDIDEVNWPQSGEIDIMENVGRLPNQVFGTLHGPGYSGGQSYGGSYDLGKPVADDYHTFAVAWQPDQIVWYIDGIQYFKATPDDAFLQGKQWVYNHPFFILMNVAVGGNFGGAVGQDTTFPQMMSIDYVRLYQAKPKPVVFKTAFQDNFIGWQKVNVPFSAFTNEDGAVLDITQIQTLAFKIPDGLNAPVFLDQLRLNCPSNMIVTSAADSGVGSLRQALNTVCVDGTIQLAPELAGQTITLSGVLTLGKNVTIDASAAPGLTISGNQTDRVFIVNASTTATVKNLTVANGYAWQLGGGILNNGSLTLDHVVVTGNRMATDAGDYWQGGGGIYNGSGATLNLIDSSVTNNTARWSGGGVYSFFDTTTNVVRSTISGNVSNDVGGAIRSLGKFTILDSTISGNTATGWHGGAIFHTDGDMVITNSTIANNIGPDWTPSAIFIGEWGAVIPSLKLTNTIITGNHWYACEHWTAGTVNIQSGGHNLVQDATCNSGTPDTTDIITTDAGIGLLADNGGSTWTHALLAGSPAIDAGDDAACSATDQRGITRPQGTHCDIGAYEAP